MGNQSLQDRNVPADQGSAAPPAPVSALSPEQLIARAIEAQVPVEALERLLAMRAELKREQARAGFFESLAGFQAHIPAIPKSRIASVQTARGSYGYRYADIADIQRAIAPELHARGLSVTFDTRHSEGGYLVACIVHHHEGHSERTEFLVPIDVQARMNDAQKAGSALTYGRRYALCAALGIVTAEEDDDGRATEGLSSSPTRLGNVSTPAGSPVTSPPPTQVTGHPSGSAPPVRPNGASDSVSVPSVPEEKGGLQLPTPAGEPIQWISPAQHRRLEALLKEAGLPRERVRDWLANRHPGAYPEGVRLNRIWVRHAEEIERRIPQFVAALQEEERRAREQQAAALTEEREALAWVKTEYGWQGDLEELEGLAVDLAAQAEGANRRAQARDGALDQRELEQARLLGERAGKLKAALRAARRAQGVQQPIAA